MVLDLDLFRDFKGGDPDKMRKNQKDRFKNVELVETVIAEDDKWRKLRFQADAYNRSKNLCSKFIGERMKKKEAVGETELKTDVPLDQVSLIDISINCKTLLISDSFDRSQPILYKG